MMDKPLLEVRQLQKQFESRRSTLDLLLRRPPERLTAVDDVTLNLLRGEALGLVGESGCGKSTLARCLVGLYKPTHGEIHFEGEPLPYKRTTIQHRRMQIVFQDPYSSLNPRMTIRQTLTELLRVHNMVAPDRVLARCRELLELVGLAPDLLDVYPQQLSGGQRQRVSIARTLALEPDVLVADEPVSALDVSVQATILNLLADLRSRFNLTLLFIAHDLSVVRYVCDRVAVMYLGRIVEIAETETLFSDPRHPYTQGLLKAIPSLVPGQQTESVAVEGDPPSPYNLPSGCRFHPRCPLCQPICRNEDPKLLPGHGDNAHRAACHFTWSEKE